MRVALLDASRRRQAANAITANIPAPVGGWNTRDSLAEMPALDASVLDNLYPRQGQVLLRGGMLNFASAMTGTVKSLAQYAPAGAGLKFFGATDSGIYEITGGGTIGGVAQALTNGYWNSVNFANSAGTAYLWGCNGTDTPKMYNGSTWATPSITAGTTGTVTPSHLTFPLVFKHRIFAIEKNTMNIWYLGIDSVQGPAEVLPFGNIFKRGGYVQGITAWTLDSGEGSDDLLVVVSSQGELAIYKGTDPASASAWALVGVWLVGKPLGTRCFQQLAGDSVVLTENGVFPLSKLLASGSINYQKALSNKIQSAFTTAVQITGIASPGWEACVYPQQDAMLINIPSTVGSDPAQYVFNTVTGAWCSFSGWDATCFAVFNGQLYFGTSGGVVRQAWIGYSDMDNDITGTVTTAYNYFGSKTLVKAVTVFRPIITTNASLELRWAISSDFAPAALNSILQRDPYTAGTLWNVGPWNTSSWGLPNQTRKQWLAAAHIPGVALALVLQLVTKNGSVTWAGTDYVVQQGGAI